MAGLRALSPRFVYGSDHLGRPILLMAAILAAAGLVYCLAAWMAGRSRGSLGLALWVFAIGIAMRMAMFTSTPLLEDDFYRYLWDGGVSAQGYNPYAYIPDHVRRVVEAPHIPDGIRELATDAGRVYTRVNHAEYGTVYPPVAQAAFAAAHWLGPWSLQAWRAVLLLFDLATLVLIAMLLRRLDRPVHYAAIYWWNPLVVKETVNSAHMDTLALPFVLLALYFALRSAPLRSGLAFALGIATKLWPIVIVPLVLRYLKRSPRQLAAAIGASAVLLALLLSPMLAAIGLGGDSGFSAYGRRWEMNDALFMVFLKASQIGSGVLGFEPAGSGAELAARLLVPPSDRGSSRLVQQNCAGHDRVISPESHAIPVVLFVVDSVPCAESESLHVVPHRHAPHVLPPVPFRLPRRHRGLRQRDRLARIRARVHPAPLGRTPQPDTARGLTHA